MLNRFYYLLSVKWDFIIIHVKRRLTRRDFLKLLRAGFVELALILIGGGGYGYLIEAGRIKVESVNLPLPRLTTSFHGMRVAQLSDIHMGGWMNKARFQNISEIVSSLKPDLLFLTGDFLIGHTFNKRSEEDLQALVDILSPLTKTLPTFAVLGNHDYWTNVNAVREMLKASGTIELTNSVFTLARGNEYLHLCGVDDVWEGNVRLDKVLHELKDDSPAILLAHEPDFADVSSVSGRFDLQVSGHSHGGQVVLPLLGPPILPYLGRKYPSGLYKVSDMYQYTNRGAGTGRLPMRINCPPEVTLFTLESKLPN